MFDGFNHKPTKGVCPWVSAAKVEQFVAHFAINKIVLFTLFKGNLLL